MRFTNIRAKVPTISPSSGFLGGGSGVEDYISKYLPCNGTLDESYFSSIINNTFTISILILTYT